MLLASAKIRYVRLANQAVNNRRLWLRFFSSPLVSKQIVNCPAGRGLQNFPWIIERMPEVLLNRGFVEISPKSYKRVSQILALLAR